MADLTPTLQAISRRFQAIENRLEDLSRVEIPSSLEAINVRDYGALGDGTTDDTAALQAALAAARSASHRRLYIPAGTYKIVTTGGYLFEPTKG